MPKQQSTATWFALNAVDDVSPTGLADPRTGEPIYAGGLDVGNYFDLTEKEANRLSYVAPDGSTALLHLGRYRRVQVDPNANPAMIRVGMFGIMSFLPSPPDVNVVTSYDKMPTAQSTLRPVAFLNVITPGNYGWIQEHGVVTALTGANVMVGAPVAIMAMQGTISSGSAPTQFGVAITAGPAGNLILIMMGSPFGPVQG